jgi:uridine kinase
MRVLILVSGSLRTFRENIRQFPSHYDFAVYMSRNDEDTYFNSENIHFLLEEPRIKTLVIEDPPVVPEEYSDERQRNIYKQWYKLYRLFQCVPSSYDIYIRLRPDVFLYNHEELDMILSYPCSNLRIPYGSDRDGINDQIAIGGYSEMKHYCNLWSSIRPNITSERLLLEHLRHPVKRIALGYKLILSTAKVIAIAGDSGSGKSTLSKLIRPLFFFDKALEFETDRYHKWERGDTHWKHTTHLDPSANYLEKLENDTFNLKLGNSVIAVDYDHSTGKFTPPETIESKNNIILCGLHTLYSKQLRDIVDLKIYVDTSDELKTQWKLQRDTGERGQPASDVLAKIESRREDYNAHIAPQKYHADIVIARHKQGLTLLVRKKEWCEGIPGTWFMNAMTVFDESIDVRNQAKAFLHELELPDVPIESGYNGVIQFTILKALYSKDG